MGLVKRVAQAGNIDLKCVGSLQLIAFEDAERFLDAVGISDVLVLGVEGFRILAGRVIPDMGAIADFSGGRVGAKAAPRSIEDARRFVRLVGEPGMYFDFVIEATRGE